MSEQLKAAAQHAIDTLNALGGIVGTSAYPDVSDAVETVKRLAALSQPAAQQPSRETLEFLLERVAVALKAAGLELVDNPGEAIEMLAADRDSARLRLAEIESTQANNVLAQQTTKEVGDGT